MGQNTIAFSYPKHITGRLRLKKHISLLFDLPFRILVPKQYGANLAGEIFNPSQPLLSSREKIPKFRLAPPPPRPYPSTIGNGSENRGLFCPRLRIPEADATVEASKTKVRKMPETFILLVDILRDKKK